MLILNTKRQAAATSRWTLHPELLLVDDEVGCKAEHVAVALLIGSPAEAEGHDEEPRALQQRHLVVQVEVTEAWGGTHRNVKPLTFLTIYLSAKSDTN